MATAAPPVPTGISRTFLIVWAGQVVSLLGTNLTGFALAIWVFQGTGSVTQLALVLMAVAVPGIILGPFAGVYADRFDRRVVMLVTDGIAGVASLGLAAAFFFGDLTMWQIVVATGISSAAQAFQEPAYLAAIPTLVSQDRLGRANGLVQLGPAVGMLVAPAIAGALLLTLGVWAVLAIDVVTFLVAVGTLAIVRFPPVPRTTVASESSVWQEAKTGFRYLLDRPGMFRLIMVFAGVNLLFGFVNVLYAPLFLSYANEAVVGAVLSVAGLGMVLGSVAMSVWGGPKRRVLGLIVMLSGMGVFIAISGVRPSLTAAAIGATGVMFIVPLANGTGQSLWQVKVELDMQGRVFSTRRMLSVAAAPLAYVLAGPLADNVFEPAMAEGGALSGVLGPVLGTGTGRGIGAMFVFVGLGALVLAVVSLLDPKIRNIERDYPDIAMPEDAPDDPFASESAEQPAQARDARPAAGGIPDPAPATVRGPDPSRWSPS